MDTGRLPTVDSQTPQTGEQPPAPGDGQGQSGGSTPPGNSEVHNGGPPTVKGQLYYTKTKRGLELFTLVSIHDFENAVTLENGNGTFICKRHEIELASVVDERRLAEKKAEYASKYAKTIALWNEGKRTCKEIAEALGIKPMHAGGQILTLKTYKLIDDTNEPTTSNEVPGGDGALPSTDDKDHSPPTEPTVSVGERGGSGTPPV